jgi:hypothetical protein
MLYPGETATTQFRLFSFPLSDRNFPSQPNAENKGLSSALLTQAAPSLLRASFKQVLVFRGAKNIFSRFPQARLPQTD